MTSRGWTWIRVGVVVVVLLLLGAAWRWTDLREWADPERLGELLEPHRYAWYSPPLVVLVFVVALLVVFPLLVLVFTCGIVFGPWLGPIYAMLGALAGAVLPFYIGRRLGREQVEHLIGKPARVINNMLDRRGIIAVFVIRKIPVPYTLSNMACGASAISFRDFMLGTILGMTGGVLVITVLGAQLMEILADPEPGHVAFAVGIVGGLALVTLLVQRLLNRRLEAKQGGDESSAATG